MLPDQLRKSDTPPAYTVQGVFFMCRRNHLRGALLLGMGLGILIGYMLESWFLGCGGGILLLVCGVYILRQK